MHLTLNALLLLVFLCFVSRVFPAPSTTTNIPHTSTTHNTIEDADIGSVIGRIRVLPLCKLKKATVYENDAAPNVDLSSLLILTEVQKKHNAIQETIFRREFNTALAKLNEEIKLQNELIKKRRESFKADFTFLSKTQPVTNLQTIPDLMQTSELVGDVIDYHHGIFGGDGGGSSSGTIEIPEQMTQQISEHESAISDLAAALTEDLVDCSQIELELTNAKEARDHIQSLFERKINLPINK